MVRSKRELAIALSRLKQIEGVNRGLEQYQTEGDLAAEMLWNASLMGDLEDATVVDLGCGNGIFGIGALLMGVSKVVFIEKDPKALSLVRANLGDYEGFEGFEILEGDISSVSIEEHIMPGTTAITIMNPPFGTKEKHADKAFLKKAFSYSKVVYSLHKQESQRFLEEFGNENDFTLERAWEYSFRIPKSHIRHKKKFLSVPVICPRFVKMSRE